MTVKYKLIFCESTGEVTETDWNKFFPWYDANPDFIGIFDNEIHYSDLSEFVDTSYWNRG